MGYIKRTRPLAVDAGATTSTTTRYDDKGRTASSSKMTTISGGQAGVIAGGTSSFGQFRLTTFVDSTPKASRANIASPVLRTTTDGNVEPPLRNVEKHSTVSPSRHLEPFSVRVQPSSQSFAPNPPTSGSHVGSSTTAATTSHHGFGILDLAPTPTREGKLGPHRDGRVRNPVPLKLKGKTDERNGNFAVMHMDMSGSGGGSDIPRSEAAQRTSESTAQAARAASKEGYTSVKRRRIDAPKNLQAGEPVALNSSFVLSPPAPPAPPVAHRSRVLTSEETKYEQARLLTLLRSINPITVVDQICKALAFFGGIPGAPPPADGTFPESADANGSGGLFVGWLSEIFPELERKSWSAEVLKPREINRGSRPRGRPKGSKASKVRKDKGIKKGPKHASKVDSRGLTTSDLPHLRPALESSTDVDNPDEEWVDIGDVELQVEEAESRGQSLLGAMNNRTEDLSKRTDQAPLIDQTSLNLDILASSQGDQNDFQSFGTIGQDYTQRSTSSAKRRPGRPKGSRNRPKNSELEDNSRVSFITPEMQQFQSGNESKISESERRSVFPSGSSLNHQAIGSTTVKKGAAAITQQPSLGLPKQRQAQTPKEAVPVTTTIPQVPGLSQEEQAVLEAFRTARAAQAAITPSNSNEKTKRGRSKGGVGSSTEALPAAVTTVSSNAADGVPGSNGKNATQITPMQQPAYKDSGPILPPPKRQRKAKDSSTTPAKRTSQTTDTSNSTPAPSTILKSTSISVEPIVPPAMSNPKPPAQGLEAHYEHFASLGHQGDQQHQQPQQQQQQPPRHDIDPVTRSSPMQSSTTYYPQSRHVPSPYEQQFPSHQTSHPYQGSLISQTDSFRTSNQQHTNFSTRQQPTTNHFNHFTNSSFMDVPALDPVANGTANVGAYGQSLSRSGSNANFASGTHIRNGFENISDNDLRDQLLRGMGRR